MSFILKQCIYLLLLFFSIAVTAEPNLTEPAAELSHAELSHAEQCIAENSGAGSITCLEKLYQESNALLDQLHQDILVNLKNRDQNNIITHTHYQLSVSAFTQSIQDFKHYRESSCNFATGHSGAAASGYSQVLYKCLIKKTQLHSEFLASFLIVKTITQ